MRDAKVQTGPLCGEGQEFPNSALSLFRIGFKAGTIKKGTRKNREEECLEFPWGRLS